MLIINDLIQRKQTKNLIPNYFQKFSTMKHHLTLPEGFLFKINLVTNCKLQIFVFLYICILVYFYCAEQCNFDSALIKFHRQKHGAWSRGHGTWGWKIVR
jgi:hypothetical protein